MEDEIKWGGVSMSGGAKKVSYEDATKEGMIRVLFMGPRRSGKSSIERVIFHNMSPHETLFLGSTNNVDISYNCSNRLVEFQTWDFGGDLNLSAEVPYMGQSISVDSIFRRSNTLVYVIDAQEDDYEDALPKLAETIAVAHAANSGMNFEVFLNKVDGDFMSDDTKAERKQYIQNYITSELADKKGEVLVSYYLTSIYDHSALEAFSKVVQKLVPPLPTLNKLLDIFISCCKIDKTYIVDVMTKLYIATDSNPVDMQSYEICSDLLDVVLDMSFIYGVTESPMGGHLAYDDNSTSAIRLQNGMMLYLRQIDHNLALVCMLNEKNFAQRALLDYNVNIFKESLKALIDEEKRNALSG